MHWLFMAFPGYYVMALIGMLINIIYICIHIVPGIIPLVLEKTDLLNMSSTVSIRSRVDMVGMLEKFSGPYFKRWQQRMKI